jgi:hypothetical protein
MKQTETQKIYSVIQELETAYSLAPQTSRYRGGRIEPSAAAYILKALAQLKELVPDATDTESNT